MNHLHVPNQGKTQKRAKGTTRFTIDVTQELIDTAKRGSSSSCAVADAVKTQVAGVAHVQVDLQTIRFSIPSRAERYVYLTPRQAQEYIVGYDAGDQLEPFKVQLRNPGVTPTKTAIPTDTGVSTRARVHRAGTAGTRRVGGRTPPKLATSTRRIYGLRALRINQPPPPLPWNPPSSDPIK